MTSPTEQERTPQSESDTDTVIAVYPDNTSLEEAVKELRRSGIDLSMLSIVGKDYYSDQQVVGYYNVGDRMKHWGKLAAFWGGLWGLFGAAFLWVPGVGPLLAAGPLAEWIVGALEGAVVVGGLGALGAGLYSLGISKDSSVKYETAIKAGRYLLVWHGAAAETTRAREILSTTKQVELSEQVLKPAAQVTA
jgi:hypothetical protein